MTGIEVRDMRAGDEPAVLAFARELPPHDLLFLPRDITQPKVLDAWMHEIERGRLTSLLAFRGAEVVGCATLVRDPLSWSPHVGELRIVVARPVRGQGMGRMLSEELGRMAVEAGVEKLVAHMTPDQTGAVTVFETMGYRAEALLRDHVKDGAGVTHDLVILSLDVARFRARADAYGLGMAEQTS
jgi:RimJ/RimL family protein N-acetyltransferase